MQTSNRNALSLPPDTPVPRRQTWGITSVFIAVPMLYLAVSRTGRFQWGGGGPEDETLESDDYGFFRRQGNGGNGGEKSNANIPHNGDKSAPGVEIRHDKGIHYYERDTAADLIPHVQGTCNILTGKWTPVVVKTSSGANAAGVGQRRLLLDEEVDLEQEKGEEEEEDDDDNEEHQNRVPNTRRRQAQSTSSSSSRLLQAAMNHPSWQLGMFDHTRRQYAWLGRQRQHHEETLQKLRTDSVTSSPLFSDMGEEDETSDEKTMYRPLRMVSQMQHSDLERKQMDGSRGGGGGGDDAKRQEYLLQADTAPVWGWPFTELWPMPSFVSVGEPELWQEWHDASHSIFEGDDENHDGHQDGDKDIEKHSLDPHHLHRNDGVELDFLLRRKWRPGNPHSLKQFQEEEPTGGEHASAPIHSHFWPPPPSSSAAASSTATGTSSPSLHGYHARDSLRSNSTAPRFAAYLQPHFNYSLTARSVEVLSVGEIHTIHVGMKRSCHDLHAAWSSRLRETIAEQYGHHRDRGCDVTADYATFLKESANSAGRAAASGTAEEEGDTANTWSARETSPSDSSSGMDLLRPAYLESVILHISSSVTNLEEEDKEKQKKKKKEKDPSTSSSSSSLYADIPIPQLGIDETYAMHISASTSPDQIFDDENNSPSPQPQGDSLSSAVLLESQLRSRSIWGGLHALETFSSIVEGWGVRKSTLGPFESPTPLLITRMYQSTLDEEDRDDDSGSDDMLHAMDKESINLFGQALAVGAVAASHVAEACNIPKKLIMMTKKDNKRNQHYSSIPIDHAAAQPISLPLILVDEPWLPWRGISLDTSRHWIPVPAILTTIEGLAASKMNTLHWHFSDAQSFPLVLKNHPELAEHGAWDSEKIYTRDDVQRIVRAAAQRGVRIVPELDMPAHAAALGQSHPQVLIHCSSIAGGGLKEMDLFALDPTHEDTFTLIEEIFTELTELFPDAHLHIGADEVAPECWASEARVREWSKNNLQALYAALPHGSVADTHSTYTVLLAYFLHRVNSIVTRLGKFTVTWEDSFEKIHATLQHRQLQARYNDGDSNSSRSSSSTTTNEDAKSVPRNGEKNVRELITSLRGGFDRMLQEKQEQQQNQQRHVLSESLQNNNSNSNNSTGSTSSPSSSNFAYPTTLLPLPSPKAGIPYLPGAIIQGWKCWVHHADEVILQAAEAATAWYEHTITVSIDQEEQQQHQPQPGVLQASCWYLDWSSPWADFYTHWPLPEHNRGVEEVAGMADAIAAAVKEAVNKSRSKPREIPPSSSSSSAHEHSTTSDKNNNNDQIQQQQQQAAEEELLLLLPRKKYPSALFEYTPYLGGEAAMWTERVDASVISCRVWPRAGVVGEVLWSQSMVYDRYARDFGQEPPFKDEPTLLGNPQDREKLHSLFAAPRYALFVRRLLRRGLPASPVAIFDISHPFVASSSPLEEGTSSSSSSSWPLSSELSTLLVGATKFETDFIPFNGMCPGIEQVIQRSVNRTKELVWGLPKWSHTIANAKKTVQTARPTMSDDDNYEIEAVDEETEEDNDIATMNSEADTPTTPYATTSVPGPPPPLSFISWNIHDGGGSHGRYEKIIEWLRGQDADVVGLVEANQWETPAPSNRRARVLAAKGRTQSDRSEGYGIGGPRRQPQYEEFNAHEDFTSLSSTSSSSYSSSPSVVVEDVDEIGEEQEEEVEELPHKLREAEFTSFAPGEDELAYLSGKKLSNIGNLSSSRHLQHQSIALTIDTTAHMTQQTAGFHRRAASAGYPYSHLLRLPSGYHLALFSVKPMTVVYEDTEHFERGILVADIGGIRFILVHLHAQDARARLQEAQWISHLIRAYTFPATKGSSSSSSSSSSTPPSLPLVVLGDFNSLSPLDADCHRVTDTVDKLEGPEVPQYLQAKYLCDVTVDEGCAAQVENSGTDAAGRLRADYRPVHTILLAPVRGGGREGGMSNNSSNGDGSQRGVVKNGKPLVDLTTGETLFWSQNTHDNSSVIVNNNNDNTSSRPGCLATYPTSALSATGEGDDAGNDNGHVPLRIDFALANTAFIESQPTTRCRVGGVWRGEGEGWKGRGEVSSSISTTLRDLLQLSDHLPLICY